MRVKAGVHDHYVDGVRYSLDRPISRELLDVLHRLLVSLDLTPKDVRAVTIDGEQPPIVETVNAQW